MVAPYLLIDKDKKMKKKVLTFVLLCFLTILSSCQNEAEATIPNIGIKQHSLNKELTLIFLYPDNHRIGETIRFVVRPRSKAEIYSDNKFGARIFVFDAETKQWTETYDNIKSYSEELFRLR